MPTTDTPEQDHAPHRYTRAAGRPSKLRVSPRPPILIVPGLHNSGPEHWQSYWERTFPNARRIDQADWDRPDLAAWTRSLAQAVRQQPGRCWSPTAWAAPSLRIFARSTKREALAGPCLSRPSTWTPGVPPFTARATFPPCRVSACRFRASSWRVKTTPMWRSGAPRPLQKGGVRNSSTLVWPGISTPRRGTALG
jgi:hypothetical protein